MLQITKLVTIMLFLGNTPLASAQESPGNRLPSVQRYDGSPDLPNQGQSIAIPFETLNCAAVQNEAWFRYQSW